MRVRLRELLPLDVLQHLQNCLLRVLRLLVQNVRHQFLQVLRVRTDHTGSSPTYIEKLVDSMVLQVLVDCEHALVVFGADAQLLELLSDLGVLSAALGGLSLSILVAGDGRGLVLGGSTHSWVSSKLITNPSF